VNDVPRRIHTRRPERESNPRSALMLDSRRHDVGRFPAGFTGNASRAGLGDLSVAVPATGHERLLAVDTSDLRPATYEAAQSIACTDLDVLGTGSPVLDATWARTGLDAVVMCLRIDDDIDIEGLLTPGAALIVQEAVPAGCPATPRSHDSHEPRLTETRVGHECLAVQAWRPLVPDRWPPSVRLRCLRPFRRRSTAERLGRDGAAGQTWAYCGSSDEPAARWDR
jgi:hypothetical protein